ncbi:hypothetical protein E18064_360014 [Elizabethkingia anophelis]|nr:hypothetical protein E18064_360014 [Elizabethkingia anophelis]
MFSFSIKLYILVLSEFLVFIHELINSTSSVN